MRLSASTRAQLFPRDSAEAQVDREAARLVCGYGLPVYHGVALDYFDRHVVGRRPRLMQRSGEDGGPCEGRGEGHRAPAEGELR